LLKETTGAFDGVRTHDLYITSQTRNSLHDLVSIYASCILELYKKGNLQPLHLLWINCERRCIFNKTTSFTLW